MAETYLHGHHDSVLRSHRWRTAENSAGYLLAHLPPDAQVLDVGCGPGTITAGLARRVAPGETIGIDLSPGVIETAKALVKGESTHRLSFEVGNVYQPRFAADSFDAIFAHQVLQHLARPSEALLRMRALLASGGVIGVREVDWGGTTFYPDNPGMRRFLELYYELARRNGGEPNAGRHLRRWFREAGFAETRVSTSTTCYADAAATRAWGETYAERTLHSNIGDKAVEYGLATPRELASIAAGWRAWGKHPDAFFCLSHTEVVAWKRQRREGAAD